MKDTFNEHPIYSMGTKLSEPDNRHIVFDSLWGLNIDKIAEHSSILYYSGLGKLDPLSCNFETHMLAVPHWTLVPVWGKIDEESFFYMLSRGQFPVNQQLRHISNLEYVYLRDTWHDTMGHVPYLFDKEYTDVMILMGLIWQLDKSTELRTALTRLYWAVIEFGMTYEYGVLKPLGAGIMSSKDELELAVTNSKNTQRDYDFLDICSWEYDPYGVQDRHYVIPNIKVFIQELKRLLRR